MTLKLLTNDKLKAVFLTLLLLCMRPMVSAQTQDIRLSPGSAYVSQRGVPWGNIFNVTYVLVPLRPEVGICFYVVNNNPTNSHTFNVSVAQTSDSGALDFSSNQGRYSTVTINGLTNPITVNASSTVAAYSGTTAAAQVAFTFSASAGAGGNPDTADLFWVQTSSNSCGAALSALNVQGTTPTGVSITGQNPLTIGGSNAVGQAQVIGAYPSDGTMSNNRPGLAIGSPNHSIALQSSQVVTPNGTSPLAVYPMYGVDAFYSGAARGMISSVGSLNSFTSGQPYGLWTTPTGTYLLVGPLSAAAATGTSALWGNGVGHITSTGPMSNCRFDLIFNSVTGTPPLTLDIWIQDSSDNNAAHFGDRIHFPQMTDTTPVDTVFSAGINPNAAMVPAIVTKKTLAVGTVKDGPMAMFGRVAYTTTGAVTNFTYTIIQTCN
jgi:hypothetical protein